MHIINKYIKTPGLTYTCLTIFCVTSAVAPVVPLLLACAPLLLPAAAAAAAPNLACAARSGTKNTGSCSWKKPQSAAAGGPRPAGCCTCMKGE